MRCCREPVALSTLGVAAGPLGGHDVAVTKPGKTALTSPVAQVTLPGRPCWPGAHRMRVALPIARPGSVLVRTLWRTAVASLAVIVALHAAGLGLVCLCGSCPTSRAWTAEAPAEHPCCASAAHGEAKALGAKLRSRDCPCAENGGHPVADEAAEPPYPTAATPPPVALLAVAGERAICVAHFRSRHPVAPFPRGPPPQARIAVFLRTCSLRI